MEQPIPHEPGGDVRLNCKLYISLMNYYELLYNGHYDELVKKALPLVETDQDAAREMHRYEALRQLYNRDEGIQRRQVRYQLLSESHELIHTRLSQAAQFGDTAAWEQLGECYYDGSCGFEQSYEKAFTCYSNGAIHDAVGSIEKLWRMMHDHHIDRPLEYVDSIALQGARCGSKRLLAETVIIHQEGRLNEYADEIERFYDPIFDAPEFTLDDDDWREVIDEQTGDEPDDDGRWDAYA